MRRLAQHPALASPAPEFVSHPNATMNIHAFHGGALRKDLSHMFQKAVPESMRESVSNLGREAGREVLRQPEVKRIRKQAREKYEEVVPQSMRASVGKVAKAGLRHALDGGSMKTRMQKAFVKVVPNKKVRESLVDLGKTATNEIVNSKPVTKVRRQVRDKYNKAVPQSLKDPLKDLGEATLEYGKKKAGYGKGLKGSPEMAAKMAKLRAMRKKKMTGGDLPPRSRSYITDPSLL
jgi:paraquat-inducible protein B